MGRGQATPRPGRAAFFARRRLRGPDATLAPDSAAGGGAIRLDRTSGLSRVAGVLVLLVATVGFCWPLPARLATHLAGAPDDNYVFAWNLWWFREARWHAAGPPFHTPMLMHPAGADLAYHATTLLNTVPGSALALFLPLPVAFNLLVMANFLLAALAMRALTAQVLRGAGTAPGAVAPLALFAAVAWGFAPFHVAHVGHLNILSIWPLPVAALALLRALEKRTWRWAAMVGAALGVCALADAYHLLAAALMLPCLAAFHPWTSSRDAGVSPGGESGTQEGPPDARALSAAAGAAAWSAARAGFCLGIALGAFALVASPVLLPVLRYGSRGLEDVRAGGADVYVADLLSWLLPSPLHPLWGSALRPAYARFTGNLAENIVFPTFAVWVLACLGLRRAGSPARAWFAVAGVFILLSLGPFLHVAGRGALEVRPGMFLRLPLPKLLLDELPLLAGARAAGRFAAVAQMGLVLAATLELGRRAYGAARGQEPGRSAAARTAPAMAATRRRVLVPAVLGLVLFECLAWPMPTTRVEIPSAYRALALEARASGRRGALLEIPPVHAGDKAYQLYQTVHGVPLLGGRLARVRRDAYDALHRDPFIARTLDNAPWRAHDGLLALDGLDSLRVEYVALHDAHRPSADIEKVLGRRFEPLAAGDGVRILRRRQDAGGH